MGTTSDSMARSSITLFVIKHIINSIENSINGIINVEFCIEPKDIDLIVFFFYFHDLSNIHHTFLFVTNKIEFIWQNRSR